MGRALKKVGLGPESLRQNLSGHLGGHSVQIPPVAENPAQAARESLALQNSGQTLRSHPMEKKRGLSLRAHLALKTTAQAARASLALQNSG